MKSTIAIIVAAGTGERAGGGTPKQFRPLLGRQMVAWSALALSRHPSIGRTVIVVPKGAYNQRQELEALCDIVVEGGETRSQSVIAGLKATEANDDTLVLIHDAARPGLSQSIITELLAALETHDAAAPAMTVDDALKDTSGDTLKTIDRAPLRRIQTPQAFRYGDILSALIDSPQDLVDDLAAIEAMGKSVALIQGEARLAKVTYEEDFEMISRLMTQQVRAPRMGTGFDVHQFGPGDQVTLCGIKIPHTHGLIGHSDADIGWHALTDAILGAVAMGDIGDHFPPSDPQWKDADSGKFLLHAQRLASEAGYALANVDITLICEAPKIKPYRDAMRAKTASLLNLPLDAVSVKATTTEGLGFTGRREGMAGQASAVLTALPKPD